MVDLKPVCTIIFFVRIAICTIINIPCSHQLQSLLSRLVLSGPLRNQSLSKYYLCQHTVASKDEDLKLPPIFHTRNQNRNLDMAPSVQNVRTPYHTSPRGHPEHNKNCEKACGKSFFFFFFLISGRRRPIILQPHRNRHCTKRHKGGKKMPLGQDRTSRPTDANKLWALREVTSWLPIQARESYAKVTDKCQKRRRHEVRGRFGRKGQEGKHRGKSNRRSHS